MNFIKNPTKSKQNKAVIAQGQYKKCAESRFGNDTISESYEFLPIANTDWGEIANNHYNLANRFIENHDFW